MKFRQQFAAAFAATDGRNHLELQRFLLVAGDDRQRYSPAVRKLFTDVAAGLRDGSADALDVQDLSPSDVAGLKFLMDHLRRSEILPLAALGNCLLGIIFEAETRQKNEQKLLHHIMLFGTKNDDNESLWTNDRDYATIKADEARLVALKRSGAASDEDTASQGDTLDRSKPDG